tara:strand:- start:986 stop:1150 length:165 start_codon:yes stop_codon:yes gene_type:complete
MISIVKEVVDNLSIEVKTDESYNGSMGDSNGKLYSTSTTIQLKYKDEVISEDTI